MYLRQDLGIFITDSKNWPLSNISHSLVANLRPTLATPWTVACQGTPQSMGFSRQEYWSGLHFLLQRIFPTQESNRGLLHCRQILYQLSYEGSPYLTHFPVRATILECLNSPLRGKDMGGVLDKEQTREKQRMKIDLREHTPLYGDVIKDILWVKTPVGKKTQCKPTSPLVNLKLTIRVSSHFPSKNESCRLAIWGSNIYTDFLRSTNVLWKNINFREQTKLAKCLKRGSKRYSGIPFQTETPQRFHALTS